MAKPDKCYQCDAVATVAICTCGRYFCADHLGIGEHDHEAIVARRAKQSKIGKSNVRRSKLHERRVAGLLTEWAGVEFRRRRVEGRDVTTMERESTADVIAVRDDIHFSIEAKCGDGASLDGLLANPRGCVISEWWHQCNYDVYLITKLFNRPFYPMMFFKPHPNFDWVAISIRVFTDRILRPKANLAVGYPVWFSHFYFDAYTRLGEISFNVVRTKNKANFRHVPLLLDPMVLCRWRDFAANVDPLSFFVAPPKTTVEATNGMQ